jgi:carbonic anhydrase/acetyltransferase-like protein (isoleucine patch superfamily)
MIIDYHGKRPKIAASAFVAPTAVIIGDVEIGEEASIWFGAILRGDNGPIRIGARSSIQDNSVIHVSAGHRTIIGDECTIGHCAVLEDCTIESGALIGSNAVVLNDAVVGAKSLIGAGSVVGATTRIPAAVVAAGAPATVKKPLEGPAVRWIEEGAAKYVALSRSYLDTGIGDPEMHEIAEAR